MAQSLKFGVVFLMLLLPLLLPGASALSIDFSQGQEAYVLADESGFVSVNLTSFKHFENGTYGFTADIGPGSSAQIGKDAWVNVTDINGSIGYGLNIELDGDGASYNRKRVNKPFKVKNGGKLKVWGDSNGPPNMRIHIGNGSSIVVVQPSGFISWGNEYGNFTIDTTDMQLDLYDQANGSVSGSYGNGTSFFYTPVFSNPPGPVVRKGTGGAWCFGYSANAAGVSVTWNSPFFAEIAAQSAGCAGAPMMSYGMYGDYGVQRVNFTDNTNKDSFFLEMEDNLKFHTGNIDCAGNVTNLIGAATRNGNDITTNWGVSCMKPGGLLANTSFVLDLWNNTAALARGSGITSGNTLSASSQWGQYPLAWKFIRYIGFTEPATTDVVTPLYNLTFTNAPTSTLTTGTSLASQGSLEWDIVPNSSAWAQFYINNSIANPGVRDRKVLKFMNTSQPAGNVLYLYNRTDGSNDWQLWAWVNFTVATNSSNTSRAYIGNTSRGWTNFYVQQEGSQTMEYLLTPQLQGAGGAAFEGIGVNVTLSSPLNTTLTDPVMNHTFTPWSNTTINGCQLHTNSTGTYQFTASNASVITNNTLSGIVYTYLPSAEGLINWNVHCNSTESFTNSSKQNFSFVLDTGPNVTRNAPATNLSTQSTLSLTFTGKDNTSGTLTAWLIANKSVRASSTSVTNGSSTVLTASPAVADGVYNASIVVSDGRTNASTGDIWVIVDGSPPLLTVIVPTNGSVVQTPRDDYSYPEAEEALWVNVTSSEALSNLTMNITNRAGDFSQNYTIPNLTGTNTTFGRYFLHTQLGAYDDFYITRFWAFNFAGLLNDTDSSNFTVNISQFQNLSVYDTDTGQGLNQTFDMAPNVTWRHTIGGTGSSPSSRKYCWYNIDNGTNYTVSTSCGAQVAGLRTSNITTADGQHNILVCYNNSYGNVSCSTSYYRIDSSSIITINNPLNTTYYNRTNYISISCTGGCPTQANYTLNSGGNTTFTTAGNWPFNTSEGFNILYVNVLIGGVLYPKSVNFTTVLACNATYSGIARTCVGEDLHFISTCTRVTKDQYVFPEWSLIYCTNGCLNAECLPDPPCSSTCKVGTTTCDGKNQIYCQDDDGNGCVEWSKTNYTQCKHGCANDFCVQRVSECSLGESRCNGNYNQFCDDDDNDGFREWSVSNKTFCDYGCAVQFNTTLNTTGSFCNYHSFNDVWALQGVISRATTDMSITFSSGDQYGTLRARTFAFGIITIIASLGFGTVSRKWEVGVMAGVAFLALGTAIGWMPFWITIPIIIIMGLGLFGKAMAGGDDG